jgi:hypothetical protein
MNEQQLAAVKQALEALMVFRYAPPAQRPLVLKAVADLEQVIAQHALYKMAEDAVTIGLSYNDWPKIGCVNHDCDQCRSVQEPVAWLHPANSTCVTTDPTAYARGIPLYTTPPAQTAVPLTDEQIDAATKAWFANDLVSGRYPFRKRMRAAFAAAHGIAAAPTQGETK